MDHRAVGPLVLAVTLWTVGCSDSNHFGPDPVRAALPSGDAASHRSAPGAAGVTALTWNVYIGAEIDRVIQARTPEEAIALATEEWAKVQASNFPGRAGALAVAIAARRPDLVGLQEVALYRTTDNPFEPATRVAYDFLQLVIDSLRARGFDYRAAAADTTSDIQVPVIAGLGASGPILAGVRFTDRDAVLVRGDVPYANARSGAYAAHQAVTIGGVTTAIYQGWTSVDATLGGQTYRFVVTHLAGQGARDIQVAQTRELLELLASESRPTILVGDFNSDVFGADPTRATPTYAMVRAAGYADSWIHPHRKAPGLTCCQRSDLLNRRSTFDQRIDFIFSRNLPRGTRLVHRGVVGDRPRDRTTFGLWPSDHAGVVATFRPRRGDDVASPAAR
jgi:hypothetical protein